MKARSFTIIIILFSLISLSSFAQISETQLHEINKLFSNWNNTNHPGGSVGIMKEGEIIFEKAYGEASLEYSVPNTASTIYNLASVSKQFTAMGIVILKNQGKLSYDDDIRKYLPYLPVFNQTITIRHMLHHTSGMRSFHSLLQLAGWRDDDSRTNEDLRRLMKTQYDLNFIPGDAYMYCNNGYIFMADIIEKITGDNFVDWMQNNIFKPLGMNNSYIEDKYNRIVPNNATSYDYDRKSKDFYRSVEYWGYIGSGNMHSNIYDILKWLNNFHNPKTGWEVLFDELQTLDNFNNGKPNDYAFGVRVDSYNNLKRISHTGSIGGFRTLDCSYPDEKLDIVILTNFSSSSLSDKFEKINNILLGKEEEIVKGKKIKTVKIKSDKLEKFCDNYWNEQEDYPRKVILRTDTLRYISENNNESNLLPISSNVFIVDEYSDNIKVTFNVLKSNQKSIYITSATDTIKLVSYLPPVISSVFIEQYVGSYYSPELMTTYYFRVENNKLVGLHTRHGNLKLEIIRENNLEGDVLGKIKIKRDEQGNITGFYASNSRAKNVWFKKIKDEL